MSLKVSLIENVSKSHTTIKMEGSVTELTDIKSHFDFPLEKTLIIHCEHVNKINSTGVKRWINFFTDLSKKGHVLIFKALSPLLVEQRNQVTDFLVNGEIYSIMIPFLCKESHCRKEFYIESDLSSILDILDFDADSDFDKFPVSPKCPHCGSDKTEFSDFVEEYFNFVNNLSKNTKAA